MTLTEASDKYKEPVCCAQSESLGLRFGFLLYAEANKTRF